MTRTISVELFGEAEILDEQLASGDYQDVSDVVRAALRALKEREVADLDFARRKIGEALADTRPLVPAEEVFSALERRYSDDTA